MVTIISKFNTSFNNVICSLPRQLMIEHIGKELIGSKVEKCSRGSGPV